jgi:hypothetical protein
MNLQKLIDQAKAEMTVTPESPAFGGNEEEGVEIIEDRISDKSRWSIIHHLIVRIKDKFYKTKYSVGATEGQDERPWEYLNDIEFTEVHQVEQVVKVWVAVI